MHQSIRKSHIHTHVHTHTLSLSLLFVFSLFHPFLFLDFSNPLSSHIRLFVDSPFACNVIAGGVATIFSGPLNFARNMKYATPPGVSDPSVWACMVRLNNGFQGRSSWVEGASYLQQRLRIGWGTARVSVGMGFGQWCFDSVKLWYQGNRA